MPGLANLDAYLARIGCTPGSSFQALHRAHGTTIPFENLDPYGGRPVALDVSSLEDKLVTRRRGGYSFEHNLLFRAALQDVGIEEVDLLLARVRRGDAPGPRPLTHLALRVVADGRPWLADVGFGAGGLLDPIPLDGELGEV
ncbi:MAG TPA: arylamine N-acetyltransferase, partial [Acidimicrobiales bacterium]|nr:arylamine N-acetyltransferase [Acidimicrobiales bacterium]